MKTPAEAGDSGRAAIEILADAGAFLTYTDATVQTGLGYWQLRYAVKCGHIPATLGGPGRVVKLLRHAVLEYAKSKGDLAKRPVTPRQLAPFVTSKLPPDFWATEPVPLPDFDPRARQEPTFTVLPPPEKESGLPPVETDPALEALVDVEKLYERLVWTGDEHERLELWSEREWLWERYHSTDPVKDPEAISHIEQEAKAVLVRLARLWVKGDHDVPF